jgi:hypothetical protein
MTLRPKNSSMRAWGSCPYPIESAIFSVAYWRVLKRSRSVLGQRPEAATRHIAVEREGSAAVVAVAV